ncbi:MAG: hypothetical protein Q7S37_04135 [bacterium]|nr:hypothetical protein [bacterium]
MKRIVCRAFVKDRNVPVRIRTNSEKIAPGVTKETRELVARGKVLASMVGLTRPIFVPDFVKVGQVWVAGYLVSEEIRGYGVYRANEDVYHGSHFARELIMPESSMDEWLKRVMLMAGAIKRLARYGQPPKGAYAGGSHAVDPYGKTPIRDGDQIVGIIGSYHKHPLPEYGTKVVVDAVLYMADPENPSNPKSLEGLKTWAPPVVRSIFEAWAPGLLSLNNPETNNSE